jgi:hypothetical protein
MTENNTDHAAWRESLIDLLVEHVPINMVDSPADVVEIIDVWHRFVTGGNDPGRNERALAWAVRLMKFPNPAPPLREAAEHHVTVATALAEYIEKGSAP